MNHVGPRGNTARIEADADKIVRRILDGDATIMGICREYRCAYYTLMRVYKPRTTVAQRAAAKRRNLLRGGHKTRFRKGQAAWNKGVKGVHHSPATEFKPGCLRGRAARRWRPIGTVTTRYEKPPKHLRGRKRKAGMPPWRGNGRRWIKVKDDGRLQDRWIQLARYLWEKEYGPIPAGYCVVHADGDTLNDSLANFRLVDHRGHLDIQTARDPGHMERCWTNGKKARERIRDARQMVRKVRKVILVGWDCAGCGAYYESRKPPDRCAKCGGYSFEKITRRAESA